MKYRSKPTEVEAMQWNGQAAPGGPPNTHSANEIVAWVNANGGEARYMPSRDDCNNVDAQQARIKIRAVSGWVYAKPGDYIVKNTWLLPFEDGLPERAFFPVPADTFESQWEPIPAEPTPDVVTGFASGETGTAHLLIDRARRVAMMNYGARPVLTDLAAALEASAAREAAAQAEIERLKARVDELEGRHEAL